MTLVLDEKSNDLQNEILESVKSEINKITDNNNSEPVNIDGVSINDSYSGRLI